MSTNEVAGGPSRVRERLPNSMPIISVVVPVYNESENPELLVNRIVPVLEGVASGSFEILFVNDTSRDNSPDILAALHKSGIRIKVLSFSRNFGHQAGLDAASGQAVVMMDADLQDPPEVLPRFIELWQEGYDVVYAVRRKRKEGVLKRTAYALFYRIMRTIAEIDVPLRCR